MSKFNPGADRIAEWLTQQTLGAEYIVEFGAGLFDKISFVQAPRRVGIEIYEPYLEVSKKRGYYDPEVKAVIGDMLAYKLLVDLPIDVAMFIDSLEHLSEGSADALLSDLKNDAKKIIVFCPDGFDPQDTDDWGLGNHYYQTHRSIWTKSKLEKLGFYVTVAENFHGNKVGALFAIWEAKQ